MAILGPAHTNSRRPRERGGRRSEMAVFVLRSVLILIASIGLVMLLSPAAKAQRGADINELVAAFVYQFTNFVEWPEDAFESADSPYIIGVIGNDKVEKGLELAVRRKSVAGRRLLIQSFDAADDLSSCQIVFIADSEKQSVADIVDRYMDKPILTVGDSDEFTKVGGIIRLYEEANKLRIEINIDAAERANLKISSKLLGLGRIVRDNDF